MANTGLWKKEIFGCRFRLLIGCVVLTALGIGLPAIHDYTLKLMESTPMPGFARIQLQELKDFRVWIWSQWFGKNLIQLGGIFAIIYGAGLISGEVSNNTIQFLLAKPVRRQDVFTVKYVVNYLALAFITAFSSAALFIAALAAGHNYPVGQYLQQVIVAMAGMGVVFSLAAFFSTVFDQSLKAVVVSGIMALLLSIPGIFPPLADYSLYYQTSGRQIFSGLGFPVLPVAVLVLVSAALYVLGRNRFTRRDL